LVLALDCCAPHPAFFVADDCSFLLPSTNHLTVSAGVNPIAAASPLMSHVQRRTRHKSRPAPRARQRALRVVSTQHLPPPLDLNNRQIRILRLLPAPSRADPIRCTLHPAYLYQNPFYEALSYAWGDAAVTRQIFVDERPVNVTVNLASALRRLRRRFEDRRLWVDALCINQLDNVNKSHQVNLMKDIYSKAPKAILWLGDYADGLAAPTSQITGAPPNPSASMTKREAVIAFRALRRCAGNDPDRCSEPKRQIQPATPEEVSAVKSP